MLASSIPPKFPVPFANSAGGGLITYPIPTPSQQGVTLGRASLVDGFVPVNFIPVGSGGVPPFGEDFNGILKMLSAVAQWTQAGGQWVYDAGFSAAIGGYANGFVLASASLPGVWWQSTVDNNTSDPDTGGANWVVVQAVAIQTQAGNWAGTDSGSANAMVIALTPAPASLAALVGVPVRFKKGPLANGAGGVTLTVGALAPTAVVNPNQTIPGIGQLPGGGIVYAIYDGSAFQIIQGDGGVSGSSIYLPQQFPGWLGVFGNGNYLDFPNSGTFSWISPITGQVRVRVLGPGGGAGFSTTSAGASAGGGGGYSHGTVQAVAGVSYTIIVGSAGVGAVSPGNGSAGGTSSAVIGGITIQATGGGGGSPGGSATAGGVGSGGAIINRGGAGAPASTTGSGGGGAATQCGPGGAGGSGGGGGGVAGNAGASAGGSAFGAAIGSTPGPNIVGAVNAPGTNTLDCVLRFPLDGFWGGGGGVSSGAGTNGGPGGGGGGNNTGSGAFGAGGPCGGGGGLPTSVGSIANGLGGIGGGGGGGGTTNAGANGGAGRVVLEW